ncbi:MAG: replicative DNA helicase [Blastocatellia bacterium]|nr:replicative DNA helicase [Blastocatellia bacterium]
MPRPGNQTSADPLMDRALPSNLDAERSVLASILIDNSLCHQAIELLKPDEFYRESHRRIYDRMRDLSGRGMPIDIVTLSSELTRAGELEQVGGPAFLASLLDTGVPLSNLEAHAKLIKEQAMLRRMILVCRKGMETCFEQEDDPETIIDRIEKDIFEIGEERIRTGFTPVSEIAHHQLQRIEEAAGRPEMLTGLSTGFADLDRMTNGLQPSDLIIVAARPSMGKCLAFDSEIVLADGSVETIETLCQRQQAHLLTLNSAYKLEWAQPSVFVNDGVKPVFRVTTRLGRTIETTATHPFLTMKGWKPLLELATGDQIAVPRLLPVFGNETYSPTVISEFATEAWKKTDISFVPAVFKLTRPCLAWFINQLFTQTNQIQQSHKKTSFEFVTPTERLARQTQHLLLRFGILTTLTPIAASSEFLYWKICPTNTEALLLLQEEIGIEAGWLAQMAAAGSGHKGVSGNKFPQATSPYPNKLADKGVNETDLYWDEIVSVESLGPKQVYDLTIPETHNFVANDICVHNTSFCLNIAENVSTLDGKSVGVFSLEMSKESLVTRLLCSQGRVDAQRMRGGFLNKDEWNSLAAALETLAQSRIFIDDTPGITVMEMRAKARRLKAQYGLDLLIVDYLQLISGKGRAENRQTEVSQISRDLKALAKELHVPVIALSQLSRASESRSDHRPMLSDLRESGSIEQDADVVGFIYREEMYGQTDENNGVAELIIAKQRNGPTGVVPLAFIKAFTRFENMWREG